MKFASTTAFRCSALAVVCSLIDVSFASLMALSVLDSVMIPHIAAPAVEGTSFQVEHLSG